MKYVHSQPNSSTSTTQDLSDLANQINVCLEKSESYRVTAGKHLLEAQRRVWAGEAGAITWEQWLNMNIKRCHRDCRKCMALASSGNPEAAVAFERLMARARMQKRRANVRPLVAELEDAIADRDRKIAELQSLIADKDREIERLRAQKRANEFRTAFGNRILGSVLPTAALLAGEDLKRTDRVEESIDRTRLFNLDIGRTAVVPSAFFDGPITQSVLAQLRRAARGRSQ